jgi:hypothetical protein
MWQQFPDVACFSSWQPTEYFLKVVTRGMPVHAC